MVSIVFRAELTAVNEPAAFAPVSRLIDPAMLLTIGAK
jgi:hypothetical protein